MGRLILILIGAFVAVMIVLWALAHLIAYFWIAVFFAVAFLGLKLAFRAGKRSGSRDQR
jgi:Flp pilus assembly protein TadB